MEEEKYITGSYGGRWKESVLFPTWYVECLLTRLRAVITDADDKNFDLEAFLTMKAAESG